MHNIKYINGYENQYVLYSGVTLDNQYAVFTVSRNYDEDFSFESGFQAGILKYDYLNETSEYFAYEPQVYLESKTSAQNSIYFAYITWVNELAEISIHRLDCRDMSARKVYSLQLEDIIAGDVKSGLWSIQMFGISDRYLVVGIPKLPYPAKGDGSRYTHHLLIDIEQQTQTIIPDQLGYNDRLIYMDSIEVVNPNHGAQLVIRTSNTSSEIAFQSLAVIAFNTFIELVHTQQPIDESYIITQTDPLNGFIGLSLLNPGMVGAYKHCFPDHRSEVVLYDVDTKQRTEIKLRNRFEKMFIEYPEVLGLKKTDSTHDLYDTSNGQRLFTTYMERTLRFANSSYALTQKFSTGHVLLHDIRNKAILAEYIGNCTSFHYIPEQKLLILVP